MGVLELSAKEIKRQAVLIQVESGELTMKEGSRSIGISERQLRRSRRRFELDGLFGLAHKSRGKPSGRALSKADDLRIRRLLHERYSDFGPTFAAEKLSLDLGRKISNEKIRQMLIEEGLHRPKKRRQAHYHPRRKRRSREGELIQSDGSAHDWLENGDPICLITFIDDATSKIKHAAFVESETTSAYMKLTKSYIEAHGRPKALYVDKHSIFRQNNKDVREKGVLTHYGRALKDVGIELICAHSPQAKGRVERGFETLQDRLVKEMRLANIKTIEEANVFLMSYLPEYNKRFAVAPTHNEDAHRPFVCSELNEIFTIRETRKLSKNLTFKHQGILYQVTEPKFVNRLRNQKVEVRVTPDHEMLVKSSWGKNLNVEVYEEAELPVQRTLDVKDLNNLWPNRSHKPSLNHPWR
jgi:hypothetical protein